MTRFRRITVRDRYRDQAGEPSLLQRAGRARLHTPQEQGLSQAELARLLGVSQQTVFAYELGDRRISVLMLVKLAKIFGVSIEALTGMTIPVRPKRRLSLAGIRHAERFQQLSKTEQRESSTSC